MSYRDEKPVLGCADDLNLSTCVPKRKVIGRCDRTVSVSSSCPEKTEDQSSAKSLNQIIPKFSHAKESNYLRLPTAYPENVNMEYFPSKYYELKSQNISDFGNSSHESRKDSDCDTSNINVKTYSQEDLTTAGISNISAKSLGDNFKRKISIEKTSKEKRPLLTFNNEKYSTFALLSKPCSIDFVQYADRLSSSKNPMQGLEDNSQKRKSLHHLHGGKKGKHCKPYRYDNVKHLGNWRTCDLNNESSLVTDIKSPPSLVALSESHTDHLNSSSVKSEDFAEIEASNSISSNCHNSDSCDKLANKCNDSGDQASSSTSISKPNSLYAKILAYEDKSSFLEHSLDDSLYNSFENEINQEREQHFVSREEADKCIKRLTESEFEVGFIDSHCHIDFLFRKQNFRWSYESYMKMCEKTDPFPKSYEGCVAVFCHPSSFCKINWWCKILSSKCVWGAFGCHPHFVFDFGENEEEFLTYALQHNKVKALGEIGLDYSRKKKNHNLQKSVFIKQLKIALKMKLPVVIHCRNAFEDCLEIVQEMLPKNYTIHWHCFISNVTEAKILMEKFPNLYLGFTGILTQNSFRATVVREAVKYIPLNRILLETDAPYFRPPYLRMGEYSHPGMAIHVALAIAEIQNISIEEVLKVTRKNTHCVYSI